MKKGLGLSLVIFMGLLMGSLTSVLYSGEPAWLTDARNGCRVLAEPRVALPSIEWSGSCSKDKRATGTGTLKWYSDGILYQTDEIGDSRGTQMVDGQIISVVPASSVQLSVTECEPDRRQKEYFRSYRVIRADVPAEIDLGQRPVAEQIFSLVEKHAWEKCPAIAPLTKSEPDLSNVVATIYQDGVLLVKARSYPKDMASGRGATTWSEYNNKVATDRRKQGEQIIQAEYQRRGEAQRTAKESEARAREAAERAAEEAKKVAARKRAAEFSKKNGVDIWLSAGELSVNPFAYEGKTVAVKVRFSQMIAQDRGLFGNEIVASGLPAALFKGRVQAVLAGKVLGNTTVKSPAGGELTLAHLRFVDAYVCSEPNCRDMADQ